MLNNKKITIEKLSLVLVSLFMFFSIFSKFQYGSGISSVFLIIVLFMYAQYKIDTVIKFSSTHFLLILFWISIVIATFFSKEVSPSRDLLVFLIYTIFIIFATSIKYKKRELTFIIKSYVFTIFLVSINVLYNYLLNNQYMWRRYSLKVLGVYKDPNYVSAFMLPAVFISLYKLLHSDKNSNTKTEYLVSTIITIATFLTGSRSAFIVLIVIISSTFLHAAVKKEKTKEISIFSLIAMFGLIAMFSSEKLYSKFNVKRLLDFKSYTNNVRLNLWQKALTVFKNRPLIGGGLHSGNRYLKTITNHHSHNMFVDIITGQGILGIFIFISILLSYIKVKKSNKFFMFVLIFSWFTPLFFINGFNTANFWAPLLFNGILSVYLKNNRLETLNNKNEEESL